VPDEVRRVFGYPDKEPQSEDCLTVNVWTPGLGPGERRPVMVWLHGGGFSTGSGNHPGYDGRRLAQRGDVVLVNVNHRLGALGYLFLGDLAGAGFEGSGNVTIFGESGGGGKANTLMAIPDARGLFHRAICMSGVAGGPMDLPTRVPATETARALIDELGFDPSDAAALQAVPVARLHEAELAVASRRSAPISLGGLTWAPVVDGAVLPEPPFDAVRDGRAADVPLLVGTTAHEASMFAMADPAFFTMDDDALAARLGGFVGEGASALLAAYRAGRPSATNQELLVAAMTDWMMRVPSIALAERRLESGGSPVWMYLFAWETPALGGMLGACHALDVPCMFHMPDHAPITGDYPESRPPCS